MYPARMFVCLFERVFVHLFVCVSERTNNHSEAGSQGILERDRLVPPHGPVTTH